MLRTLVFQISLIHIIEEKSMTGFINPFENSKDILGDIKKSKMN